MPPDRKKLKDLADSLKNTAKDLQANAKSLFDALDSNKDWGEIEKALSSVAGEHADLLESLVQMGDELGAGIRTEPTSTFANFLGEVGRAAVDTQKRLDLANRAAVAAGLATGGVPLGVFQMPKLHGEIRFALEKIDSKQVGLVFYSKKQQEQSRNEQSLAFDILSVPPPPELIQSVRRSAPGLSLVLSRAQRDAVFTTLDQVKEVLGKDEAPQAASLLEKHRSLLKGDPQERDTVIMIPWKKAPLPTGSTGDDPDGFILLYAAPPSEGEDWSVGVWQLEASPQPSQPSAGTPPPGPTPPRLHILWRFDAKGSASENVLRFKQWVRSLGEQQKDLLF